MNKPLIEQEWRPDDTLSIDFLAVAQRVYADDPWWPGEDADVLARQFSSANPFTQQGKIWTGYIRGEARLAGFSALSATGERVVNFGFWETINLLAPNQRLFSALARWAKEQGATRLVGPINFNTLGKFRLRLDCPSCPPFAGEAYNPPWYQHLLSALGFQERAKYFSLYDDAEVIQKRPLPDEDTSRWRNGDVTLQPLTPALWDNHQDALYRAITQNFSKNVGWTACSQALFNWHFNAQTIKPYCDSPGSCLAFGAEGDIAGLLFSLYDPRNQTGLFKTVMIAPRYRRTPLYATLVRHFLSSVGTRYPRLGVALLNWQGPTTRTSLQMCCGANKAFHDYALFSREITHELL
ncbi:hypothetical protein AAEY27_03845 [Kosakonia sp. BYX6]|uniref:N-acetyltransferase domain-containing protein n=1 Tax=Kosakonia calanthes TaxID=3139408 RepID=A0ABZ3B8U6_9ENTR